MTRQLGARAFRKLCDAWLEASEEAKKDNLLEGVHFALCGFGDKKFSTYMENPTKICQALELAGAKLVGARGECDAGQGGRTEQLKTANEWVQTMWKNLEEILAFDSPESGRFVEMKAATRA